MVRIWMQWFEDVHNRRVRLTDERREHIEGDHPEMRDQVAKVQETLLSPDVVVRPRTDPEVELFYRHYSITPVTEKYLCVVVKSMTDDPLIITLYFTD